MKVCKDLITIIKDSKKNSATLFQQNVLYMTEKMHKAIEELPQEQRSNTVAGS